MKVSSKDVDREVKDRHLTDTEILSGLKSEDGTVRNGALSAVFGPAGKSAVLISADRKMTHVTVTDRVDAHALFSALLYVAQQVGKQVGVHLNWVPEAPAEDEANKLVVARDFPGIVR